MCTKFLGDGLCCGPDCYGAGLYPYEDEPECYEEPNRCDMCNTRPAKGLYVDPEYGCQVLLLVCGWCWLALDLLDLEKKW